MDKQVKQLSYYGELAKPAAEITLARKISCKPNLRQGRLTVTASLHPNKLKHGIGTNVRNVKTLHMCTIACVNMLFK